MSAVLLERMKTSSIITEPWDFIPVTSLEYPVHYFFKAQSRGAINSRKSIGEITSPCFVLFSKE